MNDEADHLDYDRKLKFDYNEIWKNYSTNVEELAIIIQNRKKDRKIYYDLINEHIKNQQDSLVLEVGCGTGIDLNIVAHENINSHLYGCDISFGSISTTIRINGFFKCNIFGFTADTRNLPLKDGSFDIVYSQGLIEHFKNPVDIIREQMRVLKKDGTLIINVPQKYTGYTCAKEKLIKKGQWKLGWETSFSYKDLKDIGEILDLQEKMVCGYQYWKSWKEPTFVLRDLYDKFHRRNPFNNLFLFRFIKMIYDRVWEYIEKKWGHYFLQNIVIVFQKNK